MDYTKLSKNQLVEKIQEMELLMHQLLAENARQDGLDFAWTRNLGHWYWDIKTDTVTYNPFNVEVPFYSKDEMSGKVTYRSFTDIIHPDDYPGVREAMKKHLTGDVNVYEAEYRIRTKGNQYKWYYDRGRITQYDEQGNPLFFVGMVFDITDKKENQKNPDNRNLILSEQSSTDGLTQLKNYRALIIKLCMEAEYAKHYLSPLTVAMITVNEFKRINVEGGHLLGNKILIDIAAIIKRNIRESDFAGRFGREEFMLIFPCTEVEEAAIILKRISSLIEKSCFAEDRKVTVNSEIKKYHGEELSEFMGLNI